MTGSHAPRITRKLIWLATVLPVLLVCESRAADLAPPPTYAGRLPVYEPGQAPPHIVLGVVHAFRRQNQLLHSIYEQTGLEAQACKGNIIVGVIVGDDDPLHEGYTMWVLGLAARPSGSFQESDTLRACENCLVSWRFDASGSGLADTAAVARLETMAFSISRLRLARNGYYLLRSNEVLEGNMDSVPPLALDVRIARVSEGESQDRISFAWRITWTRNGDPFSEFAHSLRVHPSRPFDFLGTDFPTTRNALTALFGRLPSQFVDSDGDGVPDSRDMEPRTPLGYEVDYLGRTLDSDGDGIPNSIDAQPFTIQKYRLMVGSNGIPTVLDDGDYDGVRDSEDGCDSTNVRCAVDSVGCPIQEHEIVFVLVERGVLRERRIFFETGKADLLPASTARLDSLGTALSDLPDLIFNVDGHCDDRGTLEANQILSEQRAESVVRYLVGRFPGLRREQFRPRGYGETRPIEEGQTDEIRRLNRRVEISVQNPEDAKRHILGSRCRLRNEAVDGYQFKAQTGG